MFTLLPLPGFKLRHLRDSTLLTVNTKSEQTPSSSIDKTYQVYMPFEIQKMATKLPVITLKELCSRARVGKLGLYFI